MSKVVNTLIAVMLVGAFPALSLYAWSNAPRFTRENAVYVSTQSLKGMPTYAYDGMPESVEVVKVEPLRMPNTWEVTIAFTSRNAGYGDRTGMMVATVLTPHFTKIVVSEGEVIRAVTDERYDELEDRLLITDDTTADEAEEIALDFLRHAPTFSFDGVPGSMEVIDVAAAESYPVQYFVTVAFECSHAGYGDRAGQVLAQVVTPHEIRINISDDQVLSAVIDGVWDELNQREKAVSELLPPETARDIAVAYVIERYEELSDVAAPAEWAEIAEGGVPALVGYTRRMYEAGDWTVYVGYAVVARPVYEVEIEYGGEPAFNWNGTVDQNSSVTELSTSLTPNETEILGPEQARDIAVEYVEANYPELADEEHGAWEMENLTPEGLLGFSRLQYTSEGWTVEVSFPVVWKPVYSVEITVDAEPVFRWMGSVDQDGSVISVTE